MMGSTSMLFRRESRKILVVVCYCAGFARAPAGVRGVPAGVQGVLKKRAIYCLSRLCVAKDY